jgi:hypothetical protein
VHIIIATCMAQQASKGEEIDQLNSNNIADWERQAKVSWKLTTIGKCW